jgi:hypothetical protein
MTDTSRRIRRQMSLPLTALAAAAFAAGVVAGLMRYLDRSPVRATFVPGSSAWWQHAGVAVVAIALLAAAQWRHRRRCGPRSGRLWLLAPLGKAAARRVARTVSGAPGRVLLALLPALLFSYGFWRAGEQVIGGLDPNFTVNAWGGPTYLGAMACHYLDGLALMGLAAWLIDKILLPDPAASPVSAPVAAASSRKFKIVTDTGRNSARNRSRS